MLSGEWMRVTMWVMMKVRRMQNWLHLRYAPTLDSLVARQEPIPTLLAQSEVSYPGAHWGSFPEPEWCWGRLFCHLTGARDRLGCLTARLGGYTHINTHTHKNTQDEAGYTQGPWYGSYRWYNVTQNTQRNTITTISMTPLAYPLRYDKEGGVALTHGAQVGRA